MLLCYQKIPLVKMNCLFWSDTKGRTISVTVVASIKHLLSIKVLVKFPSNLRCLDTLAPHLPNYPLKVPTRYLYRICYFTKLVESSNRHSDSFNHVCNACNLLSDLYYVAQSTFCQINNSWNSYTIIRSHWIGNSQNYRRVFSFAFWSWQLLLHMLRKNQSCTEQWWWTMANRPVSS